MWMTMRSGVPEEYDHVSRIGPFIVKHGFKTMVHCIDKAPRKEQASWEKCWRGSHKIADMSRNRYRANIHKSFERCDQKAPCKPLEDIWLKSVKSRYFFGCPAAETKHQDKVDHYSIEPCYFWNGIQLISRTVEFVARKKIGKPFCSTICYFANSKKTTRCKGTTSTLNGHTRIS